MKQDILGYYIHNKSLYGIIKLFEDTFKPSYSSMKGKNKKIIFKHLEHIYRRWYYSPFIDETITSPANIINTQINNKFKAGCVFLPHVTPNFKGAGFSGFNVEYTLFTADNHPVVKDLALLLDACSPDVEIIDEQHIDNKVLEVLIPKVTFKDETYIDYLFSICIELKLLKELPSINTFRISPTKQCDNFLKQSPRKQLNQIIDAAISLAEHRLFDILPIEENIFNKKYIKNMLTSSTDLDELIPTQFISMGIDIYEILDSDGLIKEPKNEEEAIVITTFYLYNIFIDIYITCPFGYYLQLIQPLYNDSFPLMGEINGLYKAMNSNMDYEDLLYSPYSEYDLTALGEEILIKGKKTEKYHDFDDDTDFNDVYNLASNSAFRSSFTTRFQKSLMDSFAEATKGTSANPNAVKDKNKAYVFKVKHFYNKRSWKMIELKGTQTLDDLHNEIYNSFDLEREHLYSFFLSNKAWDRDSEYTGDNHNSHSKKASKTKIHSLGLSLKQKFLYLYDFGDEIKFEVELVQVNDLDSNANYPRVIKESKA